MSIVGEAAKAQEQEQQSTSKEGDNEQQQQSNEQQNQQQAEQKPEGGKGQAEAPPFYVPEAYKHDPALKSIKDWDGLYKTFTNAQKLLGRSYRLPAEADDANTRSEKLNEIYRVLGRPEAPDKYELGDLPKLPGGIDWAPEALNEFRQIAYELGLPATGVKKLVEHYAKNLNDLIPDPDQEAEEVASKLRGEWGDALYEKSVAEATYAAKLLGGPDFIEFLNKTGLGNNEMFIRIFAKIGRDYREDGTITAEMLNTRDGKSLQGELDAILADKNDPYHNKKHGKHAERVEYVNSIHAQLAAIEEEAKRG